MIERMETSSTAEAPAAPAQPSRDRIADRFKWNLSHIFDDWDAWQRGYDELERKIAQYAALQGTLKGGPDTLLAALRQQLAQAPTARSGSSNQQPMPAREPMPAPQGAIQER